MKNDPKTGEVLPVASIPTNVLPIEAVAFNGEVVISGGGAYPIDAAFAPEAILASLENLKAAAVEAIAQKAAECEEAQADIPVAAE